jgi:uncharacterized membrane protein
MRFFNCGHDSGRRRTRCGHGDDRSRRRTVLRVCLFGHLGLRQADARTFVDAMQRINVAIINAWFMVCFVGAPVLILLAAALHLDDDRRAALPWIVAALIST